MIEYDFPYNLPIWRDTFQLDSPDGKWATKIFRATEVSMGNPTMGTLELSNGFKLDRCNPSFIWSDDSRYLVIPHFFHRFGLFRRQHLIIIDVAGLFVLFRLIKIQKRRLLYGTHGANITWIFQKGMLKKFPLTGFRNM